MKMVLKYARDGAAKYISHLDMQRTFSRMLRRAGLPVQYSQGFNPHIVMSFASPLSVGYATRADYLEVGMLDGADISGAQQALNKVSTRDIQVLDAFRMPDIRKKLMALNHSAAYDVAFAYEKTDDCDTMGRAVHNLNESSTLVTTDRKGRSVDIRPYVLRLEHADGTVHTVLKNSASGALNPAVLATALLELAGLKMEYTVCRTECYAMLDGSVLPFGSLHK